MAAGAKIALYALSSDPGEYYAGRTFAMEVQERSGGLAAWGIISLYPCIDLRDGRESLLMSTCGEISGRCACAPGRFDREECIILS